MDQLSFLSNADPSAIEALYQSYQNDPDSVEFGWKKFFEGFDLGLQREGSAQPFATEKNSFLKTDPNSLNIPDQEHFLKEIKVLNMIDGYRSRGHLFTKTNPVRERRKYFPGKDLSTFGLSESDLDTYFNSGVELGLGKAKLRDIRTLLEETYCGSIGIEYDYSRNPIKLKWFQERMETNRNQPHFSLEQKKRILQKLNEAVVFENFLGTKFLGQKRFSLEGAESLIPGLDAVISKGAELGIQEFIIGMAHRGRLNVLANVMNKTYKDIFTEFEGKGYDVKEPFGGDVKYHLGYSTDIVLDNGKSIHLSLSPNPSHLETVDGVVQGMARSKIDQKYNHDLNKLAPILIHGDASIAGQGIVYEVLQMSKLDGYKTGGTIHLIINNQIGFTTNFKDARSSTYCSDIGKITLSPVFHVNGDDVEALVYSIQMAMEYRQTFHNDVFIDILCYRRYGHNESDEPRFTQPTLYKAIEQHPNPREIYNQKLLDQGSVDAGLAKEMEISFRKTLQERLEEAKQEDSPIITPIFQGSWTGLRFSKPGDWLRSPQTSVPEDVLMELGLKISSLPSDKKFLKKIERLFDQRLKMFTETKTLDWAMGEQLAYASLLKEGHRVRISGQDVERGTFSHRHAVLKLEDSEEEYVPLSNIGPDQASFEIYNSLLSEYGVLGFEFGYAMASPDTLTIWEAQYGDFANGAQIVIDQYLASGETKWKRSNGLVLYLPHGYEGGGAEHSSARVERFLDLCAEYNMQIANCTTPANLFHLIRRQLKRDFRKPLVLFTPKSLLRHPLCVSKLSEFSSGTFKEVIDDSFIQDPLKVSRVIFCTGKIYYDLLERQQNENRTDIAIVRLEQIYPTPVNQLSKIMDRYVSATEHVWVQEEPRNMGAWPYLVRKFRNMDIRVIARHESSTPATGHAKTHVLEQEFIINKAFRIASAFRISPAENGRPILENSLRNKLESTNNGDTVHLAEAGK
jgi:2-oxoglutarate dehydrogenase E1 component